MLAEPDSEALRPWTSTGADHRYDPSVNYLPVLTQRIIMAAALLLVLGAGLVTFLPSNPQNMKCGTWVNPEWPEDETRALVQRFQETAEDTEWASSYTDLSSESASNARIVAETYLMCDDKLSTRHTWTFILLGGALLTLVVPIAIGWRLPRDEDGDDDLDSETES